MRTVMSLQKEVYFAKQLHINIILACDTVAQKSISEYNNYIKLKNACTL